MTEEERLTIPAYVLWKKLKPVFLLDRKTKELGTKEERDEYSDTAVRGGFEELAAAVEGTNKGGCTEGSYLSSAISYFENQEVYLRIILDDSNIASNNAKAERCFAFFWVLRSQIKMFGSEKAAENASILESLEQTARAYVDSYLVAYLMAETPYEQINSFEEYAGKQLPKTDLKVLSKLRKAKPMQYACLVKADRLLNTTARRWHKLWFKNETITNSSHLKIAPCHV